jgi:hypothetical protein
MSLITEGEAMTGYKVLVYDNTYYGDESERIDHGVFATADEAIAKCKKIIDDDLKAMWKPGTSTTALYQLYICWGRTRSSCRSNRTIQHWHSRLGRMQRNDAKSL